MEATVRRTSGIWCLAAVGWLLASPPLLAQSPQAPSPAHVSRTISAQPARPVFIDVSVGDIVITGSARPDLSIDLRREGGGALPLVIEESPDAVRISALQADEGTDPALGASVAIQAPSGTRFASIRLTDGRLTLTDLTGGVDAVLTRGDVKASSLGGRVRLETGIGDIDVEKVRLAADGPIRLRAFNGHVTLLLERRPADARILALVLSGDIQSDLPLERKERFGPRFAEATFGRGEPVISIDVVNGTITIRAPGE